MTVTVITDSQAVDLTGLAAAIVLKVVEHLEEIETLQERKGCIQIHHAPGVISWQAQGQDEPFPYENRRLA